MGFVLIFITVGKDPFIEQQVKERRMWCEQDYLMRENILVCPLLFLVKMTAFCPWKFLPSSFMKLFVLTSVVDLGNLLHELMGPHAKKLLPKALLADSSAPYLCCPFISFSPVQKALMSPC